MNRPNVRNSMGLLKLLSHAVLTGFIGLFCGRAIAFDLKSWEASIDPQTKGRYIPVELWAGVEWDGKRDLKMPKVDGTYRHQNAQYQIKGPQEWKHPVTGETAIVYERTNPGKDGVKLQLFTINQEQTGLGRLFDGRPGRDTRTSSGGLKFPVGFWRDGETKSFTYKVWDTSREGQRTETITLKKNDFIFRDTPHCLEFYWNVTERIRNQTLTHDRQTYIYCPGKSMVSQIQN